MAWRLSYFFELGAVMVFVVAPYVVDAIPVFERCSSGMINVPVDDGTNRCCEDIICPPGYEPEVCSKDNPKPKCRPCRDGTYQPKSSQLSHPQWMKCRHKTNCDVQGTKYRTVGNTSTDSTCECIPGYFCDNDQCLPSGRCRVGYGRDAKTGNCLPCALGETYSDVEDVSEPCKTVTRCESLNFCTVKPATVQHDSVCGNSTADCDRDEDESVILPAKDVIVVTIDGARNPLNETPKSSDEPITITTPTFRDIDHAAQHGMTRTYIISVGIVSFFAIVGVLGVVLKNKAIKKQYEEKLKRARGSDAIKRLDPRYLNTENQLADFEIFKDALEQTSASYGKLGKELLGENKLKAIEADCKDMNYTGIDMVHEILDAWNQKKGLEDSAMLPNLYDALKRAKMYDTICLIDEKLARVSSQSNDSADSATPLTEQPAGVSASCHPLQLMYVGKTDLRS